MPNTHNQMKKLLLATIAFLFFTSTFAQTATKPKSIKPAGTPKKIETVVNGKTRSYYAMSTETSVINLMGPGTLKVNTRGQFKSGDETAINYTILYSVDGGPVKSIAVKDIKRSAKAAYADGKLGFPGELNVFAIELPRGAHNIEFKLKEITTNVAARYMFTPAKLKKQEWMVFSPQLPLEPVDLISKEVTTGYYRFSVAKPLKIEIIGPTELRVLTRSEIQYQMKGKIKYRVQVKENGIVINTYQMNSQPSEVAVYKDIKNMIPGTACEFVIYVPEGVHHYEIAPLDKDKPTLLGRLLIPKKDLKLEAK
jgi:hypothetical protein